MRAWIKSACVVLAWSILPIILVAAGMTGSVHPAQANTRTASSTEVTLTSTLSIAAAPVTATTHTTRYVVHNGDTLSGIAARFAVRGGWPALYAANRKAIGPDPDVIHSGTVLTVPRSAAPAPPAPGRAFGRQHPPAPPPAPSAGPRHDRLPVRTGAPVATGVPRWLTTLLLAVGLVILAVFPAGPVLAVRRRRPQAAGRAVRPGKASATRWRDRGGRSRSAAAAVRPVAAAARVHPVGVAVPSAVVAAGIVLFTFVQSATIRVVPPPGGPGPGSVYAARPSTGQPHHRLRPCQPGPPGLPALPSSPGQNARSLTGGLEQIASPLPAPAAVPPAGPGRAPQASRNRSSPLPGGGLVCDATQVPSPAATAAAGSGGAGR